MDKGRSFISFDFKEFDIHFRDSNRIFPTSLRSLCGMFDVSLTKGTFNFDSLTLKTLQDEKVRADLIDYLNRDIESLMDVVVSARNMILEEYNVDLIDIYSTSSLAMNIFRVNFLDKVIPLLPRSVESQS
jgi:hypothetical protein